MIRSQRPPERCVDVVSLAHHQVVSLLPLGLEIEICGLRECQDALRMPAENWSVLEGLLEALDRVVADRL